MSKIIFLDAGPLGILVNPRTPPPPLTVAALRRIIGLTSDGHRLGAWNTAQPDRYLPLTDSALRRGAELSAQARNSGTLPADPRERNGNVLIAAQALDYEATWGIALAGLAVATVNIGHLSLFVPADAWTNIHP